MKWGQNLLCGWPGLPQLWLRGNYTSLIWAIGFSVVLNLALVSTFIWPALLGDVAPAIAWPILFLVWLVTTWGALHSIVDLSKPPKMSSEQERSDFSTEKSGIIVSDDPAELQRENSHTLFNQAQREYLRGHWAEAESLLKRRLKLAERDIEARLLLATLFRHTERLDWASEQLLQLEKYDESVHWNFEIRRERELIGLLQDEAPDPSTDLQ